MNIKIIISSLILMTVSAITLAHPGRTASDGCHYCRTNCTSWGVPENERHCHGGSLKPQSEVGKLTKVSSALKFDGEERVKVLEATKHSHERDSTDHTHSL